MRSVWYVLDDGAIVDPGEVAPNDDGRLQHKGGGLVAMRGAVPSSCGVDLDKDGKMVDAKQMRPGQSGPGYLDRQMQTSAGGPLDHDKDGRPGGSPKPEGDAGDIAALRAEYQKVVDKKPFPGWDAETLRAKIAAHQQPKVD